ncbi:unnamed protein product, partial [Allacma fusca]
HFIDALGPDGSPVIVEVNETELTEDEKISLKIKKPKVPEKETEAPDFIEVTGPDGIPMLVEIKDVRDKLPQEETDSRNVIRKLP